MKPKHTPWTALACFVALTFLLSNSIGCGGIILDRTTTIYGKVIDESRQPVDSIPIIVATGAGKPAGIPLDVVYTNKQGEYRIVITPKGLRTVLLAVDLNAEATVRFKDYLTYLNGERVDYCCSVSVGKEANYDFLLISR